MKNDIFDITWSTKKDDMDLKIYFREENKKYVAYLEIDGEINKFDQCLVFNFFDGISSYWMAFKFIKKDKMIEGTVIDSLTFVPSNVSYQGNIALSDDARLFLNTRDSQIEFKKHVKKMIKLSEIARVQVGKKLKPVSGGMAFYVDGKSQYDRGLRVNEVMVDGEHAAFFGIAKDNLSFMTYCDDNDGRYCAGEGIAILTNIENRFDKPWILDDIRCQARQILNKTGQSVLTLDQVKNIVLEDEKYKLIVQMFGDFGVIW